MNVKWELQNIEFEWDSKKAFINLKKHEIGFETACEIFFDPFVKYLDTEMVDGERRDRIVGMTERMRILFVVHVVTKENVYRIISARKVTKAERKIYEDQ